MTVLESAERHQELIDELIESVAAYNKDVDRDLLTRAFRFAAAAHEGQQRRSGEPMQPPRDRNRPCMKNTPTRLLRL